MAVNDKSSTDTSSDDNSTHGLEFHFDKDEVSAKAAAADDPWFHPTYSTVTYLNCDNAEHPPGGVPLVVYETQAGIETGSLYPEHSWILFPLPNRHVVFSGNMLHGCPADLIPKLMDQQGTQIGSGKYSRLSLAVNIWTKHTPLGLTRLNVNELYAQKTNVDIKVDHKKQKVTTAAVIVPDIPLNASDHTYIKKVKVNSKTQITDHLEGDTAPLPIHDIQTEFEIFTQSVLEGGGQREGVNCMVVVHYSAK